MSDEFEIYRPEPAAGSIMPVRLAGRLHVPACLDCEEPSKCCVFGCAYAAVVAMAKITRAHVEALRLCIAAVQGEWPNETETYRASDLASKLADALESFLPPEGT